MNKAQRIAMLATAEHPNFVPFDLETRVRKIGDDYSPMPYGIDSPMPFAGGYGGFRFYELEPEGALQALEDILEMMAEQVPKITCGHNLKFDIQHLPGPIPPTTLIWDTMVAEYILTAQGTKMASLAELCVKYSKQPKKDLIGENLAKGITPDQIPQAELMAYLEEDLSLVKYVAERQFQLAQERGMVELILSQGDATVAYAYAERNGMPLDVRLCVERRDGNAKCVTHLEKTVSDYVRKFCAVPAGVLDADLLTPRLLSMAFFGTPENITVKIPLQPGTKKRGNQKYEPAEIAACPIHKAVRPEMIGLTVPDLKTGNSWWKTDDVILGKIISKFTTSHFGDFAMEILKLRHHTKLLNTYYQALLEHADKYKDGIVHHTINQCIAVTGRTTSERPNAQNMPPEVREVIVSPSSLRHSVPSIHSSAHSGGLLEVDFRQLEICALAQLSGDPALIKALRDGEDIHYLTGQLVYGYKSKADETPERRRIIKTINFGLAYGGGAFTLAEQAGVAVQTARNAIEAFYRRFPGTKTYNDRYHEQVATTPESAVIQAPSGPLPVTRRTHTMGSLTGRRYAYTEQDTPEWLRAKTGAAVTFSPTQTKNYPVQGFATGDLVPLAVGMLAHYTSVPYKIMNVVHDSILLSFADESGKQALLGDIYEMMNALPAAIETLWGIEMTVPLRAEIKEGKNWGDMHATPDDLE